MAKVLKMTERMKKMLYNLYKGIANQTVDSNDQLYYIELLKANSEFVDEVINAQWHISNSLNYKNTFFKININFEFVMMVLVELMLLMEILIVDILILSIINGSIIKNISPFRSRKTRQNKMP